MVCSEAYNIITLDTIDLTPRIHNPRIIARNASYNVHALALQLADLLDVWGQVTRLATGSKGPGNRE